MPSRLARQAACTAWPQLRLTDGPGGNGSAQNGQLPPVVHPRQVKHGGQLGSPLQLEQRWPQGRARRQLPDSRSRQEGAEQT
mmetsp:Transcript_98683/g.287823  ORF Transcript_98683/g.287823 Transcript_98683/m.287823 type:complete len:82 (-) Transcript_98683:568-813(-)